MIYEHQDFIPSFCVYVWEPKQMLWCKQKTGRDVDGIGAVVFKSIWAPIWQNGPSGILADFV